MFFNLIKEIKRLRKKINRLLSKGMSNICLKIAMRRSPNVDFLGLKNLSPGYFLGSSSSLRYHSISKTLVAT